MEHDSENFSSNNDMSQDGEPELAEIIVSTDNNIATRMDLFRPYQVSATGTTPTWSFLPTSFPNLGVQFPPNLTPNMPNISSYLPSMPANFPSLSMPRIPTFNVPSVPSFSLPSMPSIPSVTDLMSSRPRRSWSELKESVRVAHRRLSEVSNKVPFAFNFAPIQVEHNSKVMTGVRLYFLCPSSNSSETSLHYCDVLDDEVNDTHNFANDEDRRKLLKAAYDWRPLVESRFKSSAGTSINIEEKLQMERKRMMLSGITSYEMDPTSRRFVFSCGSNLFYFEDNPATNEAPHLPTKLESNFKSAKINPQICPSNPDLIAFVSDDDLFVANVKSGQEVRLTDSNRDCRKSLSMGLPSYVIQEEFRRYTGFWWRPEACLQEKSMANGTLEDRPNCIQYSILYEEVDETDVELIRIPSFDGGIEEYHFPRPGEQNATSILRLVVFTFDSVTNSILEAQSTFSHISLPSLHSISNDFEYLVRVGWWNHDCIWVQLLNRKQTRLVLGIISVSNRFPPQVLYEEIATNYWINVSDVLHLVQSNSSALLSVGSDVKFVWSSEESGFRHLYTISTRLNGPSSPAAGENILEKVDAVCPDIAMEVSLSYVKSSLVDKVQLTSGNWEVSDKDVWVDVARNLIYFVALRELPLERHLYVTNLEPSNSGTSNLKRLTDSGFSHTYIAMDVPNFQYFVNVQSNISIPPFGFIHKIGGKVVPHSPKRRNKHGPPKYGSLPEFNKLGLVVSNPFISSVEMNPVSSRSSLSLINELTDFLPGLPKPELFTYQLKSSGDIIYGVIFKPEFMENGVKYPCLLDIYGGPEVQVVSNSFKGVRQVRRHLLASEGYVVCAFDCRGSHHRGKVFEGHIYKRMGQVEIEDQVEVLEWLAENTGYIDMKRIAIHGWSYGGYLSLMAFAQRPDIFKLSIAGAPVCKWTLYDTGYTERYMDTPFNNPEGYTKGNVLNYIHDFPNEENRLLIIHGLMDENVHFNHSIELINALIKAGKPYQLQVYPFERHSLRNSPCCEHYETHLLSYLQQYL